MGIKCIPDTAPAFALALACDDEDEPPRPPRLPKRIFRKSFLKNKSFFFNFSFTILAELITLNKSIPTQINVLSYISAVGRLGEASVNSRNVIFLYH